MKPPIFSGQTARSADRSDAYEVTISEAILLYRLEYLALSNLSPLTRSTYSRDLDDFGDWVVTQRAGDSPTLLRSIDSALLERYLDFLASCGLASAYRRRKVAAIRSFFGFLETAGRIQHSPADQLIPPAKEFSWPRVLSVAEFTHLREVARHDIRDSALIELLLQTGLLLSEVSGIRLQEVVLPPSIDRAGVDNGVSVDKGLLRVNGRGRKQRSVMLNWRASRALRSYLRVRPACDDDHLFLTKFHRGMGPRAVERVVEKYLKQAGIDDASVQSLRHTYATYLLRFGATLKFVQESLGHESLGTTRAYLENARRLKNDSSGGFSL